MRIFRALFFAAGYPKGHPAACAFEERIWRRFTMKKIGIEDFMNYSYPTGMAVSPDGKHGAFAVVNVNGRENGYDSSLWIMELESGGYRRLTFGGKERAFVWLDEETLLFSSVREREFAERGKRGEDWTCFYTINIHGGEAQPAFSVPFQTVKFRPAEDKLVMSVKYDYGKPELSGLEGAEKEKALKAWQDEKDYEVFDELPFWSNGQGIVNKKRVRLAVYDMKSKESRIITPDYENVDNFWVEGDQVLYTGYFYRERKERKSGLYSYRLADGSRETLVPQDELRIDYACMLKGRVMFFGSDMKLFGLNENPDLYVIEKGAAVKLAEYDRSIHNSICSDCKFADGAEIVHDDSRIYFISTLRKQSVIRAFDENGVLETLTDRQGSVHTLEICRGRLYFTGMRGMGLTEIYCLDGKEERKLTSFHDAVLEEREVCPVEEFTFSYKGVELDGYVMKPAGFEPDKTYPGILTVHGGPRAVFGPVFFHESQAFANAGYFVFFTNPVGSDGRGNVFADLAGKYGTIDFENCMAFTDEVLKRYPQLDEKRLGIMGGSYGGFMVNWAIGHTDRFAAAVSQRSISNWVSLSMTADIGYSFDIQETDGDPWNGLEKMWICSPLKYADKAKTPTLFIQSDEDYRCYMGDALQMFSALKYFGVDARMCLFHGENHELSRSGKPAHRIRRLREMMDWFEKYLKP